MIKIYIDGQVLDMPSQAYSSHWANWRFTDILADQYSTDIELPMSARNIKLLDVWGLADRAGQIFGQGIRCSVVTARMSTDATLRVSKVTHEAITVTLYYDALPSSLKAELGKLILDDEDTIIDWQAQSKEDVGNVHDVNISGYDYGIDLFSSPDALFYPNIKVNYILSRIEQQTGVSIAPQTYADLRLLCTRRVLCPQNTRQNILAETPANGLTHDGTIKIYGQHIATERVGEYVRFNRAAGSVKFTLESIGQGMLNAGETGTVYVEMSSDNGATWTTIYTATCAENEHQSGSYSTAVDEGDLVRLRGDGTGITGTVQTFIAMQIEDYAIDYSDYGKEMDFINTPIPAWVQGRSDMLCYMYYGAICNLPSMTVRELLTGIMWKTGTKIVATANSISWAAADSIEDIEARILSTAFTSDKFGQKNIFESADGVELLSWPIVNDAIELEKVVNKSLFGYTPDVTSSYDTFARVPQYAWELKDDNTAELKVTEYKHPVLTKCESYVLRAITAVNTQGLRTISRIIEVEGITDAEIAKLDYVRIGGHKYMLIEGDVDEVSGLTTFKGLLI